MQEDMKDYFSFSGCMEVALKWLSLGEEEYVVQVNGMVQRFV